MKATFIHDHYFAYNPKNGKYYDGSGGAFTENLWNRYLAVFDFLEVVGRSSMLTSSQLVVSSSKNVNFHLIENVNGVKNLLLNKEAVKSQLKEILATTDFLIIRLPSTLGKWAFEICKRTDKKYVLEIVGDPFEAYLFHGSFLGKLIAPIEYLRLKAVVANAKSVIYVTQNKLQERYPCKNNSVGISNVRLMSQSTAGEVRNYYLKDNKKFTIGLIGTFHVKYKGHREALLALKKLIEDGFDNVILNLVGTGDSSWIKDLALKLGIANNIIIKGSLKSGNEGVIPFLDSLDLYIHPSKTEGLPRVIIEAMSRGKVCLSSDVGGTSELLDKEYLHDAGDWRKLSLQIKTIIHFSKKERISIGLENLNTSNNYLESTLQNIRRAFLNKIISDESN